MYTNIIHLVNVMLAVAVDGGKVIGQCLNLKITLRGAKNINLIIIQRFFVY